MALGDGIRRNIATVSDAERNRFRDAIIALNKAPFIYPGVESDPVPGGVTFWFKQDEIHQATHVHGGPAFLTWHRELCNRFEALLRQADAQLSLHYWDWTTDPTSLFTNTFMGSANGDAGQPWLAANIYNPAANPSRGDPFDFAHYHPAAPPADLTRGVAGGVPALGVSDNTIVNSADFPTMRNNLEQAHNSAHGYIGGTLLDQHASFRDPFVFLLHSNVDRLLALWQLKDPATRLDPDQVYGSEANTVAGPPPFPGSPGTVGILTPLEPWAGLAAPGIEVGVRATRPWAPPENQDQLPENQKNSRHPSVVAPPCYDTNPTIILVKTPPGNALDFNDVPAGETAIRAAVFQVNTCADLTFVVSAGPTAPYAILSPPLGSLTVHANDSNTPLQEARIWFSFTGTTAGTNAPAGSVTIHCNETGQDFVFTLNGNTIARPTVAVMLTLDQSGSMDDPAGNTGVKRVEVLRSAASTFVDVIQANNGVGLVRFDTVAYAVNDPTFPGLAVTKIGSDSMVDAGRIAARGAVLAHKTNPLGNTSIGAGVKLARDTITPVAGFDDKALIVFTDGLQNTAPLIADVMGSIDDRTFAIGLGNAQQVSTAALTALTNGTGGQLLLTDVLTASLDDYFLVYKYFLQILAGVTNTDIVKDPTGLITPGMVVRVPFVLNDTDIDCTPILLTDIPAVRFSIETPAGAIITPGSAPGLGVTFNVGQNIDYYRFTLPVPIGSGAGAGTWNAILELDERTFERLCHGVAGVNATKGQQCRGVRFSVNVLSWSNLRMKARLYQNSLQPGGTLTLRAVLKEYGQPVDHRATVRAEMTRPDGTGTTLLLAEIEPGVFETSTVAMIPGVYKFHVIASGFSMRGIPFTREQTLTGAVFPGGDNPGETTPGGPGGGEQLCCLLGCLLADPGVERFLKEKGIDAAALLRCVKKCCQSGHLSGNDSGHGHLKSVLEPIHQAISQLLTASGNPKKLP
jgi:Common central domain of tyrosinase